MKLSRYLSYMTQVGLASIVDIESQAKVPVQICPWFDDKNYVRCIGLLAGIITFDDRLNMRKTGVIRFTNGLYRQIYFEDFRILDKTPTGFRREWEAVSAKDAERAYRLFYPGATWEKNRRILVPDADDVEPDTRYLTKNIIVYPHDSSIWDGTGVQIGYTYNTKDIEKMCKQIGLNPKDLGENVFLSPYSISTANCLPFDRKRQGIEFTKHCEGAKMFHVLMSAKEGNK